MDNVCQIIFVSAEGLPYLERLEEVFACGVLSTLVNHRVGRKVRESVVGFVFVVEQDPGTLIRVLAEPGRRTPVTN